MMKSTCFRYVLSSLIAVLLAGLLGACSSKEVKPVSPESKTALEAFAVAEAVRSGFESNDKQALQKHSTEAGYKDITLNKKAYTSVSLAFTPRWVEIEKDQVSVNVAWQSTWTIGDRKVEDRGMAVFVMEGTPLRLSKILRANPFVCPEQ
jgi:hypothetical protein